MGRIVIWQSSRCPGFWCGILWGKAHIERVASGGSEHEVYALLREWR